MKLSNIAPLFLAVAGLSTANGMQGRTQTKKTRQLEEECESWSINHDIAQTSIEIDVTLETFPSEGEGLFKITMNNATTFGWCIDYGRRIDAGVWSVDVFSAFDKDIHDKAVDKSDMFPNLAYLINTYNVGDTWESSATCAGGTITWKELQGAVWWLIDDENGEGTGWKTGRVDCISEGIADDAQVNGKDYVLDCSNPDELVPLVLVVDDVAEVVLNQTIISETNIHSIAGFCECIDDRGGSEPTPEKTQPPTIAPTPTPAPTPEGSSSGDPHFKTWTGTKFDYHGECDLVLLDHPSFNDGQGLRVHIRTTRVGYFSFIEKVAIQIGEEVLEFNNDVEAFLINGKPVPHKKKHYETKLGGFAVRRDPKAISVRIADGTGPHQKVGAAKIDFIQRQNGFPAVIVSGGHTDIFKGSLGLLGDFTTGQTLARDGKTVIPVAKHDSTDYALEWQVRDNEPMLFQESRFPQFPTTCTPPDKMPKENRLGAARLKKEAEEACAHWKEDKEDCIFDVMATRDVQVALEGQFVNIE